MGWLSNLYLVLCNNIKVGVIVDFESKIKISGAYEIFEFMVNSASSERYLDLMAAA